MEERRGMTDSKDHGGLFAIVYPKSQKMVLKKEMWLIIKSSAST